MSSDYEASKLVRRNTANSLRRTAEPNCIGVALVALSLLLAFALLYSAWFDWTAGPRTARAVPVSTIAGPMIHPPASGLPEAALFLRNPPREGGDLVVLQTGTSAR